MRKLTRLVHGRRAALAALAIALATPLAALVPSPAQADNSTTLTVVGTSDTFDSGLVQAVLKPGFEKAYPGVTLNYVSQGTGAAINFAKAGTASALLVHAASLENQFVADGYSLEPYGRAIFYGDYVLTGPPSDPAGAAATASHDIVAAYQKVAAAGAAGTATFVSRGGTPGTTVQEHAIWALTTGVQTCTVSAANGGGTSPSTVSGPCPSPIPYPSWYKATGVTQAPNILQGETCPPASYPNGGCYVFTDRGTYNYLQSTGAVTQLKIVTRANDSTATGGPDLLVNSFHAYAINPAKFAGNPNVQLNSKSATDFLNWVTSPAGQAAVGAYLNGSKDAPFLPSAAPALTASTVPAKVDGGKRFTVFGTLKNVVPGTPTLSGVPVKLMAVPTSNKDATPVQVAVQPTNSSGTYTINYRPKRSMTYSLAVDSVTKIENASLSPVFGDILAPTSASLGTVKVKGAVKLKKTSLNKTKRKLTVTGVLKPGAANTGARIKVYVGGKGQALTFKATKKVKLNAKRFTVTFQLPKGTSRYQIKYVNNGVILAGKSPKKTVTVS